ncbi:lysophospholipid acyltransferase family protein [Rhodoferax sp.]|uniref:lysophospholipid acyltransferase family protein n=1 Tax=Rhodoferax sp. TaxID=50421 RepID=UPI002ACE3367|nr:lysophospholipid acyltransferase family protein [Rhodoferax sp.]MDZ7918789.1 lysophospholipid acyltransferase family protein [Rhodoferax sp.]
MARNAVQRTFRWFVWWMAALGVMSFEIRGQERLNRTGLLVLANHPTLIDVVFLISLLPNADCIVKSTLARNPFTRGPVRAANYICNDSGAGMVEDCIHSLRQGSNLIIFPEGTRTGVDGKITLQRGAANVAVRGGRDITPVRIHCAPRTLTKGLAWWQVPSARAHFVIDVCDDIDIQSFLDEGPGDALAARRLTHFLTNYFSGSDLNHGLA